MKRHLLAAIIGAAAGLLFAALPLWRQQQRLNAAGATVAGKSPSLLQRITGDTTPRRDAGKVTDGTPHSSKDLRSTTATAVQSNLRRATLRQHLKSSRDRATAATEILQTTPPDKLEQVSASVMQLWVQEDMAAAGDWLNAQPDSPAKAAAATVYALEAVKEDPAAALRWADTLTDPAARARTQRRVFTAWHDARPAEAAAWLPQSGWSEAQQQAARDMMAVRP